MSANTHEFTYQVDSDENSDSTIDADTLEELKATLSGVQLNTNIIAFSISITSESTPFKPSEATVDDGTTTDEQQSKEADALAHECDECGETFDSETGRKIHQARWCDAQDTSKDAENDDENQTPDDEVNVTVHGDTSRWDEDDTSENDYLDRIDDGEDIDPEDMVESQVKRNTGTWYVLALLTRVQGRLQSGQVHAMLKGTEWELKKGTAHQALRSLRDKGLVDDEGKSSFNGYQTTQLGRDYLEAKNATTPGYDLLVADQITGRTDTDAIQQEARA